jgi:protease II
LRNLESDADVRKYINAENAYSDLFFNSNLNLIQQLIEEARAFDSTLDLSNITGFSLDAAHLF